MSCGKLYSLLTRSKDITVKATESALHRCLNVCDLTFLGIGATVGAGLYVVTGQVAKNIAGPGIVLSFLIAAIASMLAGLCYAEFGCRVSKAGSAYVYTYATLGEFWAFVIGWNMILEYIIGNASLAKGLSEYIDSIFNGAIRDFLTLHVKFEVSWLGAYPDFLAFSMPLLIAVIVCMGAKSSTTFNKIVTFINLAVVLFVIGVGLWHVDTSNWTPRQNFAPYGASGILAGAASCFFCFVGFDVIATASEETINPSRTIPMSIVLSLLVSFFCYFGVATVLTLMVPFDQLRDEAPLAKAFGDHAFKAGQYIVTVGGLAALFGALLGGTFAVPRIIYAMAKDGLLFSYFSKVNQSTSTPVRAIVAASILSSVLAFIFDLKELVEMLSIGTLMAYTMVAVCVVVLRFQPGIQSIEDNGGGTSSYVFCCKANPDAFQDYLKMDTSSFVSSPPSTDTANSSKSSKDKEDTKKDVPDRQSSVIATTSLGLIIFGMGGVSAVFIGAWSNLVSEDPWAITTLTLSSIVIIMGVVIMVFQPRNNARFPFTVPCVPVLPLASILINIFLLLKLSYLTWIRFAVWLAIGLVIYFFYGIQHSIEGKQSKDDGSAIQLIIPPPPDTYYDTKQIQPLAKKQPDDDEDEDFERYVEN